MTTALQVTSVLSVLIVLAVAYVQSRSSRAVKGWLAARDAFRHDPTAAILDGHQRPADRLVEDADYLRWRAYTVDLVALAVINAVVAVLLVVVQH